MPAQFDTCTPRPRAAGRSILSTPAPARSTIWAAGPAPQRGVGAGAARRGAGKRRASGGVGGHGVGGQWRRRFARLPRQLAHELCLQNTRGRNARVEIQLGVGIREFYFVRCARGLVGAWRRRVHPRFVRRMLKRTSRAPVAAIVAAVTRVERTMIMCGSNFAVASGRDAASRSGRNKMQCPAVLRFSMTSLLMLSAIRIRNVLDVRL